MMRADAPQHVPERVISALKARVDENGYVKLLPKLSFGKGAAVRVLEGTFVIA